MITAILIMGALLCLLMFMRTLRTPRFPSRTALLLTFLFAALWCIDSLGQYLAWTPEQLLFFAYLSPIPIAPTFWFGIAFILIQSDNLDPRRLPAIALFTTAWTAGILVLHQVDALRPLILATSVVEVVGGRPYWHWTPGPAFAVIFVVNIVVYSGMLFLVLRSIAKAGPVHRVHRIGIFLGSLMPMGVNVAMVLGDLQTDGIDPTPLTLLPSCILYYWLTAHRHLAMLSPVPRHFLIDTIPDPILVLRDGDVVVEANKAASGLGGLPAEPIGSRLSEYPAFAPCLAQRPAPAAADVRLSVPNVAEPRIFSLEVTSYDEAYGTRGTMLIFRDVTERTSLENLVLRMVDELKAKLAENVDLQHRLREQAIRDPLTGLFNRHHCAEIYPRLVAEAVDEGRPFAAVLVDLDHFKAVNDDFGHPVGDHVLRVAADVLAGAAGDDGLAFRYGGEEFLLLLPGMSAAAAAAAADRCRAEMAAATVRSPMLRRAVTLSAGVAVCPNDAREWAHLMQRADLALYRAKASGRDRVEIWTPQTSAMPAAVVQPLQVGRKA